MRSFARRRFAENAEAVSLDDPRRRLPIFACILTKPISWGEPTTLTGPGFPERLFLTDGGVYDISVSNLYESPSRSAVPAA